MRAHPMVGDSLIAGLLLLIDLAILLLSRLGPPEDQFGPWQLALPLDLLMVLPLVFRRKHPLLVAYLVLVISIPHAAFELGLAPLTAGAVSVYSVVVYSGRKQGAIYLVATLAVSEVQTFIQYPEQWLINSIILVLILAFCWTLGEFAGARRAYQAELEARLHLLETERDQASRIAVAEERSRIARELHDVVAHAVSVMVVQADGASYAIRSDPALAERAVRTISGTGRGALAELRRLLDVLRNEDANGEPRVPQPGTEALGELAERIRTAGVPVRLDLGEELAELPTGVALGVYRIVQESLTNTLKHAGQGATAEVRVWRSGDAVRVEVTDDGAGKARALVSDDDTSAVAGGNGLIGMRERANVFGGTLEVGPNPGGGWRVRATLPTP
ncbi:Signal transduction histidine kinase [Amycolatopsis marina]|uniref:histidine kinase n=2 Tax=Amycolatopsis marina TaxID=490629 RepID=A0A1I0VTU2_9PSEU|nr:Signal transduction histidine kinase [Amycolatopsis marina]